MTTGTSTLSRHWIDGAWQEGSGAIAVVNPATGETVAEVPAGGAAEVDAAVLAARHAFPRWAATSLADRVAMVTAVREGIKARSAEIAASITAEMGSPTKFANSVQVGMPMATSKGVAGLAESFPWTEEIGNSLVVREPVGVVAAITPWNYPLHQVVAKVAAALAAGCTVVLKPSEVAPLSAFALAEVFEQVGLPAGVFNLVTGVGPVVGAAMSAHPDIDMISFTGSTAAGKAVTKSGADTVKRIALELGGKSPNIILEGADLEKAVADGVGKAFLNSGQTCSALTRMIVPRSRLAEVEDIATRTAETFTPGDPFAETTRLGPLVSNVQRERVRGYIQKGIDEGAKLLTGGVEAPEGLDTGYFVRPTVFSEVRNDMTIAQEEIFGPVLSIIPYDTEQEAVEIANDTIYGLAGGVWAADKETATAVARQLRTGQVEVNGGSFNPMAPFGGYKQSGHGRELGTFGLEEFLETKSMQL